MIPVSWKSRRPIVAAVTFAMLVPCALALSGCGRSSAAASPVLSAPGSATSSPLTMVELAASQLGAIRIAPVTTFRFPVEKTELGSVAFAEDPAIVQAESTLLAAAANLELTRKELRRARLLHATQGVSGRELEQARSDAQTAAAALAAARVALHALGKSDSQIERMIATGEVDSPPSHGSSKWVQANVFETDAPAIHVGQPARIAVTAYPGKVFTGTVRRIYATVDPSLHRQTVRCETSDPRNLLRPGMLATVTFVVGAPLAAAAVPVDGVVREGDGTLTAWVTVDRRHFTQRVIRAGLREDGQVQVLAGLRPGDLVVTHGAIFLDNMVNAVPSD